MELLIADPRAQLVEYIQQHEHDFAQWKYIEIGLKNSDSAAEIKAASTVLMQRYIIEQGKLLIRNDREMLLIAKTGDAAADAVKSEVQNALLEYECSVDVQNVTKAEIEKLVDSFDQEVRKSTANNQFTQTRNHRKSNVVFIADDDAYIRKLVKTALPKNIVVHEYENANDIATAYEEIIPDIVFLDIHLPGLSGVDILKQLYALDKHAYVIMLSADSSRENVLSTRELGASGFMTKPFSKERLIDFYHRCPTLSAIELGIARRCSSNPPFCHLPRLAVGI